MGVSHQEAVNMSGEIKERLQEKLQGDVGAAAVACRPVVLPAGQTSRSRVVVEVGVVSPEHACIAHDVINNLRYADDTIVTVTSREAEESLAGGQPIFGEFPARAVTEETAAAFSINNL